MRSVQLHGHHYARVVSFLPAQGAEAPAVARFQAGKLVFRAGGGKVVAAALCEFQELLGHDRADYVATTIGGAGVTNTVAKVAGYGVGTAADEWFSENVVGHVEVYFLV